MRRMLTRLIGKVVDRIRGSRIEEIRMEKV